MSRFVAAAAVAVLAGCTCTDTTKKRFPRIEVLNADGTERTLVDFGTVQVDMTHERRLRVRNGGAALLTLSRLSAGEPFGTATALPATLGAGEELELLVTYRPTVANQRHTGRLTIGSDDPDRPELTVDLAGQGIQAVAVASPDPIDFGDVYVGESKTLRVTVSNAGSNELEIQKAAFAAGTPSTVSGDLSPLQTKVPAGGSVAADVTFAPTSIAPTDALAGALELTLNPLQGAKLSVPLRGRAVQAIPRLCFKMDDTGIETCTDPASATPSLQVRFPPLCDNTLFGPDAGALACNSATNPGSKTGRFYFKNEGNIPVSYSVDYVQYPYTFDRCDAGYPPELDFKLSNAPALADGGLAHRWTSPTTKLPQNAADPKPWETAPVTVTYRATSRCANEATDQARVLWNRQGDPVSRAPQNILMFIDGTSKLPKAVAADWNCTSQCVSAPCCRAPFYGVSNAGTAPLEVRAVQLFEAGLDGGFDPTLPIPCDPDNPVPGGSCVQFKWEPPDGGGDPNRRLPIVLDAGNPPTVPQVQAQLGMLLFGWNPADLPQQNRDYVLYAVIDTSDPYSPKVVARIRARRQ